MMFHYDAIQRININKTQFIRRGCNFIYFIFLDIKYNAIFQDLPP